MRETDSSLRSSVLSLPVPRLAPHHATKLEHGWLYAGLKERRGNQGTRTEGPREAIEREKPQRKRSDRDDDLSFLQLSFLTTCLSCEPQVTHHTFTRRPYFTQSLKQQARRRKRYQDTRGREEPSSAPCRKIKLGDAHVRPFLFFSSFFFLCRSLFH